MSRDQGRTACWMTSGELSKIGLDGSGMTRLAWSTELDGALRWLEAKVRQAGLEVERDAAGNIVDGNPIRLCEEESNE